MTNFETKPGKQDRDRAPQAGAFSLASQVTRHASRVTSRGFTLVEILVTVALMSFIILGLLMMFSQTQRAFVSSMTQVDVLEGGRDVIDMVANDLVNMTPSEQANTLNFYADTNDLFNLQLYPEAYLQGLPPYQTGGPWRTNFMQKFYFVSKNNLVWSAVGYQVVPDDGNNVVGTLYRFVTNISVYALPSFTIGLTNSSRANFDFLNSAYAFTSSNKIADGIVHFRIRAFSTNGFPITSDRFGNAWFRSSPTNQLTSNEMNNASAMLWGPNSPSLYTPYWSAQEPMGYKFWSNAMPAEVELEVGMVEPQTLRTYQGLAPGGPQINYLSNHVANVHLFRQRIHLGNVDPSAY